MTGLKSPAELKARFRYPKNWQASDMINERGRPLHCVQALPKGSVAGHVLLVEGLGEFTSKFTELARNFNKQSWGFYIFDRQGQGLSGRNTDHPYLIHCEDYREDVKDIFQYAMTKIPDDGKPVILLGPSTGGLLSMPVLHEDSQKPASQRIFAGAVLTDPLWGFLEPGARDQEEKFASWPLPPEMLKAAPPPLSQEWIARHDPRSLHKPGDYSTDPQRCLLQDIWQTAIPALRASSATMGWLQQMSQAIMTIRSPGYVESIEHPITVCTSDMSLHVDEKKIMDVLGRMQNGRHMAFPEGKHELLMEQNRIRRPIIAETIRLGLTG